MWTYLAVARTGSLLLWIFIRFNNNHYGTVVLMMMIIFINWTVNASSPNELCGTGRTYLKGEAAESWAWERGRKMSHCIHVGNTYFGYMTEQIRKWTKIWTSLTWKLESRHNSGNDSDSLIQYLVIEGGAVAQWLRCCATNRKVARSIPTGVTGIFHWHRTMALGSTQPLTEMSTRSIS